MNGFFKSKNSINFLLLISIFLIFGQTHRDCDDFCLNNEECIQKCLEFDQNLEREPEFYSQLNSINSRYCGQQYFHRDIAFYAKDRIIGGVDALSSEFPWMASLQKEDSKGFKHYCGGAVIHDYYVLTAAHCADSFIGSESKLRIIVGANNIYDKSVGVALRVSEINVHKGWNRINNYNDIALYKTDRPINYSINKNNQYVLNSICLPEAEEEQLPKEAVIAGWGRSQLKGKDVDSIKKATVPLFSWSKCRVNYKNIGDIDRNMLCYGGLGNIDSCMGDSGGPLMEKRGNKYFLIGIVSYGIPCAQKVFPTVFIKVSKYIDWIHKNIEK